jgi:hypothetical protein
MKQIAVQRAHIGKGRFEIFGEEKAEFPPRSRLMLGAFNRENFEDVKLRIKGWSQRLHVGNDRQLGNYSLPLGMPSLHPAK